jgi:hypothetical protein
MMHRSMSQNRQVRWARLLVGAVITALVMLPAVTNATFSPSAWRQLLAGDIDTPPASKAPGYDQGEHCTCPNGQSQSCCSGDDGASGCNLCGLCVATIPTHITLVTLPAFSCEVQVPPCHDGLTIPPETKPPRHLQAFLRR